MNSADPPHVVAGQNLENDVDPCVLFGLTNPGVFSFVDGGVYGMQYQEAVPGETVIAPLRYY